MPDHKTHNLQNKTANRGHHQQGRFLCIMVPLPNVSDVTVLCDDGTIKHLKLPMRAIIYPSLHCNLSLVTFMVHKVNYRNMGHIINNLTFNKTFQIMDDHELVSEKLNMHLQRCYVLNNLILVRTSSSE